MKRLPVSALFGIFAAAVFSQSMFASTDIGRVRTRDRYRGNRKTKEMPAGNKLMRRCARSGNVRGW